MPSLLDAAGTKSLSAPLSVTLLQTPSPGEEVQLEQLGSQATSCLGERWAPRTPTMEEALPRRTQAKWLSTKALLP